MSTTPQFEIPTDMRKMNEQSMEHGRGVRRLAPRKVNALNYFSALN